MKAARRKALPKSAFALPSKRQYPIDTKARARNALARASQPNTASNYQTVAKAVRKKWGNKIASTGTAKGTVARPAYRKGK
jgi:hypothetical protein